MEWTKNGKPAYRLVYVVGKEQIFILHAFSKTSDGTPKSEEETNKERYKQISKIV
ncbi:type II toxin-antitoxin system RelE/ParE family toxin [Escherichia coli]